jgi:tetratricopeptide (TPR) repeat protein
VPKLADLNRAFTQAKSPQALMTAYYLASQAVGYIVERFGWDKMRPMLLAWGQGKRTPDIFLEVLGASIEDVDRDLRAHLRKRLERFDRDFHIDFSRYNDIDALEKAAQQKPTDAEAQAALALGLVGERRLAEGEKAARRALALNSKHTGALFALTRVALQEEDLAEVERLLHAILATGQDGYVIRILLARAALANKRHEVARKEAEAAIAIDPEQLEAHRVLLEVAAMRASIGAPDKALALRALQALAQLDQHDPMLQLAWITALREAKDYAGLRTAAESALYLMPAQPDVHLALGEGLLAAGEPAAALIELDRALSLGHKRPDEVGRARAQALQAIPAAKKPVRPVPKK